VQRVLALERCYNAREGLRRMDDYPFYLWWQKKYGKPHPVYTGDKVPLAEKNTIRLWMHGTLCADTIWKPVFPPGKN
jgi:hypothetical protein